ncbi:MAG: lipoprotein [Ruminococcus sp.]|nr:lipoprotein [Ruminococcus sp.]
MKKILLLLLAAAMLTSCSSKKSSGVSEPPPVDDTAVESPIIEYNASDFKKLEMPSEFLEKSAGIETEKIELNKLDVFKGVDIKDYRINRTWYEGDNVYFSADFSKSKKFKVYRYSYLTKESSEIYSEDSDENNPYAYQAILVDEKQLIYFDSERTYVKAKDITTGKVRDVYHLPDVNIYNLGYVNGHVYIYEAGKNIEYRIARLDINTGKTEVMDKNYNLYSDKSTSKSIAWTMEPTAGDDKRFDIVTDYYRLHTGLSNFEVLDVTEDTVILQWTISNKIFTFNMNKMEEYWTDFSSSSSAFAVNGKLFINHASDNEYNVYCFIPEIGKGFDIEDNVSYAYIDGVLGEYPVLKSELFISPEIPEDATYIVDNPTIYVNLIVLKKGV